MIYPQNKGTLTTNWLILGRAAVNIDLATRWFYDLMIWWLQTTHIYTSKHMNQNSHALWIEQKKLILSICLAKLPVDCINAKSIYQLTALPALIYPIHSVACLAVRYHFYYFFIIVFLLVNSRDIFCDWFLQGIFNKLLFGFIPSFF